MEYEYIEISVILDWFLKSSQKLMLWTMDSFIPLDQDLLEIVEISW